MFRKGDASMRPRLLQPRKVALPMLLTKGVSSGFNEAPATTAEERRPTQPSPSMVPEASMRPRLLQPRKAW